MSNNDGKSFMPVSVTCTAVAAKAGTVSLPKDRNVTIQKFEAFEKDRNFWKGIQVPLWLRPLVVR